MTRAPIVSIILPTFCRLAFLRAAVDSVLAQTFHDWELIIADDGSDEGTRAYLRDLDDQRIKVIYLAHTGNPAAVRNAALREAVGTYVAFLDSDDVWVADKLDTQLAALGSQHGRRWCYAAYTRIDETGRTREYPGSKPWTPHQGSIFEQILQFDADIVTATVMVERDLLVAVGGFDEGQSMLEDYDLWVRLIIESEIVAIERPLVGMRSHDEHYGASGLTVQLSLERSLTKIRGLVAGSPRAAVVDKALARNQLELALAFAGTDRRAALRFLCNGWPLAMRHPRNWTTLARACLLLVVPRRVLALRRAWRARLRGGTSRAFLGPDHR